ncbi:hypothetical protein Acr_28g0003590 [Actinidia rufa]|uniref:Uncharacterized protein n=1 Tax=Actinidia rufa TaxID=165716 RepID=A0A7J0HA92_9ERIC|nr:hypothetical protein Acr_28g0003590 [Actinidia rufa]
MLVRDSEALAQFRVDHRIPDDVIIERPGPNDDADWVEGEGNRMSIRTWFIYQAGHRFPLSKLLKSVLSICGLTFMQVSVNFVRTVLAVEALMQREGLEFTVEDLFHVYCVVKPRKNPETQMLEGNHYLRLRKPNQPQTRLVTDSPDKDQYLNDFIWISGQWEFPVNEPDLFSVPRHRGYVPVGFNRRFWRRSDRCSAAISAVNNCGRSRKVSDLLGYIPLYRYTIPLRAARQERPVLPPLQIRGPGSRPRSSLSDEVSDLFEGTSAELRRLLEEAEGESSGSSESSSSSWDIDLGDEALNEEAEVEDGEEVDQIPAAAPLIPAPLVLVPEPINLPSSDSDVAIVEAREIVEHSYSHSDSSSAGSQLNAEIMAPKVRILGKKQAPTNEPPTLPEAPISSTPAPAEDQSTAPSLMGGKRKGKQPAEGTSRPKRGKGEGSAAGTPSCGPLSLPLWSSANKLPQRILPGTMRPVLRWATRKVWWICLKELQIPLDHPAWSFPAPPVQLPASPERYSPINLPDFNEEEYATLPAAEGNTNSVAVEAHAGIAETADRDRAGEAEGDRVLEAEGENLV